MTGNVYPFKAAASRFKFENVRVIRGEGVARELLVLVLTGAWMSSNERKVKY